jgi:hypothetical protein
VRLVAKVSNIQCYTRYTNTVMSLMKNLVTLAVGGIDNSLVAWCVNEWFIVLTYKDFLVHFCGVSFRSIRLRWS